MDIGKYMDEMNIRQKVAMENLFSPQMQDIPQIQEKSFDIESDQQINAYIKKNIAKMLMAGYHKDKIIDRFANNNRIGKQKLNQFISDIERRDGIVGSLIVDCNAFDKGFSYQKCSSKMKKYYRFAMNSKNVKEIVHKIRKSNADGSIDGLLGSQQSLLVKKEYVDQESGLPIINSTKDIPRSVLCSVVDEMVKNGDMSCKKASEIKSSKNILSSLKESFLNLGKTVVKQSEVKKYADYNLQDEKLNVDNVSQNELIHIKDLSQKNQFDKDIDVYDNSDLEIEQNTSFSEKPDIEIKDIGDQIQFDNEEYVDQELFDKPEVVIVQEDMFHPKEDLQISDKYSFDF